jgi:hypothetical protein
VASRKSGNVEKAFDVREAARGLGELAIQTLNSIMEGEGSDAAKLGAAREVLERAYGKTRAPDEGAGEPVTVVIRRFARPEKEA